MIRDIDIEEAINIPNAQFIDLRSPAEFQQTPIPGAVNIPLLMDEERAEIGIIYRHAGQNSAKKRGLEMIGPRLAQMIEEIEKMSTQKEIILYCWRGGERSRSVAQVLDIMGVKGYRLNGGYRSYRNLVVQRLSEMPQGSVVVIHGLTGTGKTVIIKELDKMGFPAIDLEGLANHRGSVFGGLGLGEQPTQKHFESVLLEKMMAYSHFPYIIVESESKKIGRLFTPDRLFDLMKKGYHVLVYDNLENRIDRLFEEYVENLVETNNIFMNSLQGLTKHIGKKRIQEISSLIENNKYREAISILLVEYYDPLYGYENQPDSKYDLSVDAGNSIKAAESIARWLNEMMERGGRLAKSG